jgi:Na+/proline symporter
VLVGLDRLVEVLGSRQVIFTEGSQPVMSAIDGRGQPILDILPNFAMWDLALMIFVLPLAVGWWANWYPGSEPGGGSYIAQRMLASKTEKDSLGGALFFNVAHYVLRPWPWIITALCSIVVFPELKDIQAAFPAADPRLIGHDSAFPAMLMFLPTGFIGLMVGGLIAANSSTILTHLNWGASYLVHDFYRRFIARDAGERHYVNAGRVTTVLLYVAAGLLGLRLESAQVAFQIIISIGAGTGLLYMLRWYWWRINAWCEVVAMISSFAISMAFFLLGRAGYQKPFAQTVLYSVAFTTACWLLTAFITPETSRETLIAFYEKVRPAGPGWARVRRQAGIDVAETARETDNMRLALLGWLSGCAVIWSALFATGNFLYGRLTFALVLAGVFAVSGAALLYVIRRLWDRDAALATRAATT